MPGHPALPHDTLRVVEIHYFRVPRERWELMVLRARQSGANGVSAYIPWIHHQPTSDAPDLTGVTSAERDLVGFVDLCARHGLGFVAKPGPFCDSEMLGGGVPTWLLEAHPAWWAVRHDGAPYRHGDSDDPRLSYDNPDVQACAGEWLAAVAIALEPFVDRNLWAVQIDNETPGDGMWIHEDGTAPSPIRADLASTERWQSFLARRYGTVDALNDAWGSAHAAFDDIGFPATWTAPDTVEGLRPWLDLDRFADAQMGSGLAAYAASVRSVLGDRVPHFHDWLCMPWQLSGMLVDPGVLADTCGWVGQNVYAEGVDPDDMIAGTAWYRMNDIEYVHHAWWRTRLCHTLSPPGLPHLVPEVSARQAFYLQCSLVGGMDAPCIYMLHASEPEPVGIGAFQRWAEEAPVLPDGSVLEWWWNLRCLFLCLEAGGSALADSPLDADVAIVWDHAGERLARWSGIIDGGGFPEGSSFGTVAAGANTAAAGIRLARRLVDAGITFDVVDPTRTALDRYTTVLVPDTTVLSRHALTELLSAGPRVAWLGGAPRLDEDLRAVDGVEGVDEVVTADLDEVLDRLQTASEHIGDGAGLPTGIDLGVRTGADGTRFVTVVNRTHASWSGEVLGVAMTAGAASVTWFALRVDGTTGGAVAAALIHGDDAVVGGLGCSQGQCAIAWLPLRTPDTTAPDTTAPDTTAGDPGSGQSSGAWHVISQERAWITVPAAAGLPLWRVTLAGKVLEAGVVGDDGRFRFIARDDVGETDRYVAGDRRAADAAAAPVVDFFMATAEAAGREAEALGVDPREVAHLIRRTRSRLAAGSATDDEVARLDALTRLSARTNDLRLGES